MAVTTSASPVLAHSASRPRLVRLRAVGKRLVPALVLVLGLGVSVPATAADTVQPGHLPAPQGGTTAVGGGIGLTNENAQLADRVPAAIKGGWRRSATSCPQSAGSGATSISVTKKITVVHEIQYRCGWVSAYTTSSGKRLWTKRYLRSYRAQVMGSTVYVWHEDADGLERLDALRLTSGKRRWTTDNVGIGSQYDYAPAVGSHLVLTSLLAVDSRTGETRWSIPTDDTTSENAASLIVDGRIYVNSSDGVSAYDAERGTKLWGRKKDGVGMWSGVSRPVLHDGRLYVSDLRTTLALDAATGELVRRLPGTYRALALDGRVGFFTTSGYPEKSDTISAVDLFDGHVYWSHDLDLAEGETFRMTTTPPVVSNGLVWVQDGVSTGVKGRLVALDEVTGSARSSTTQPCPPVMIDYASITIAQNRIFSPSTCGVLTYVKR